MRSMGSRPEPNIPHPSFADTASSVCLYIFSTCLQRVLLEEARDNKGDQTRYKAALK